MQGLWKTKIGGYNSKSLKRKSCSRKHLLKDKARIVRRLIRSKDISYILNKNIEALYSEIFEVNNIKHWAMRSSYKDIQTMVHRQIRASIRNWIVKEDWDRERKSVGNEKSIAWIID